MDDLSVTEPAVAGEPASESAPAVTQPIPVVASESCAQCAAALAPDQRYCLHCGAPRAHVSGPISGGRPGGPPPPPSSPAAGPPVSPTPSAPPGSPGAQPALSQPASRNNTLALLAGVGVLLLAMGVGVLIGRAGVSTSKAPPTQVISVGGSAAGATTTATTPTATTETPAAASAKKAAKAKASSSPSIGSSITKPAPATVLKSVTKNQSGSSYEQKSKNLPNVVETG